MSLKERLIEADQEKKEAEKFPKRFLKENRERAKVASLLINESNRVKPVFHELAQEVEDPLIIEWPLRDEGKYAISFLWGFREEEFNGQTITKWHAIVAKNYYGTYGKEIQCPEGSFRLIGDTPRDFIKTNPELTETLIADLFSRVENDSFAGVDICSKKEAITRLKQATKNLDFIHLYDERTYNINRFFSGKLLLERSNLLQTLEKKAENLPDARFVYSDPSTGQFATALRWNFIKGPRGLFCNEVGVLVKELSADRQREILFRLPNGGGVRSHVPLIQIWGAEPTVTKLIPSRRPIPKSIFNMRFTSGKVSFENYASGMLKLSSESRRKARIELLSAIARPYKRANTINGEIFPIPKPNTFEVENPSEKKPNNHNNSEGEAQLREEDEEDDYLQQQEEEEMYRDQPHPQDGCYTDAEGNDVHGERCEDAPSY